MLSSEYWGWKWILEIMYNLAAPSTEMKILLKIINKNIVKTLFYFCVKLLHLISISFNILKLKIPWSVVIRLSDFFQSTSVLKLFFLKCKTNTNTVWVTILCRIIKLKYYSIISMTEIFLQTCVIHIWVRK